MAAEDMRVSARHVLAVWRGDNKWPAPSQDGLFHSGVRRLAELWLEDHPEDDGARVDAAMLLAKGWRRSGVGQVLMMADGQPKEVERAVYYDTEESSDMERLFVRDHEGDTAYIPCGPTVGDLRAACRVLRLGVI